MTDILQVGADVLHIGETQQNFGEVFFTDGGHPLRVGQELNFQHLGLKVVHKPWIKEKRFQEKHLKGQFTWT